MRIVGILLAAGRGSRFGGGKLLARLSDGTAVGVQSARRLHAVLKEVVAVVRPDDDVLAGMLSAEGVRVERCADAAEGMGRSLAHAVRATADADGWVVALADMPLVAPDTIAQVADAIGRGAIIAAPAHGGRRGHPVGFASGLGARLGALAGDAGARDILREEAARVLLLPVDDPGILADIDTPQQLHAVNVRAAE